MSVQNGENAWQTTTTTTAKMTTEKQSKAKIHENNVQQVNYILSSWPLRMEWQNWRHKKRSIQTKQHRIALGAKSGKITSANTDYRTRFGQETSVIITIDYDYSFIEVFQFESSATEKKTKRKQNDWTRIFESIFSMILFIFSLILFSVSCSCWLAPELNLVIDRLLVFCVVVVIAKIVNLVWMFGFWGYCNAIQNLHVPFANIVKCAVDSCAIFIIPILMSSRQWCSHLSIHYMNISKDSLSLNPYFGWIFCACPPESQMSNHTTIGRRFKLIEI